MPSRSKPEQKPNSKREPKSARDKVREHRERLRAQGLRPIQIWVPDVRTPEFAAEARRQSRLMAEADRKSGDLDFVDSISDYV